LGPSGTLVIPTFTYSATKDITYDANSSESQVGPVTEWFRINAGAKRTSDPIFSVAVKGALSEKIINAPYSDSFGQNSFFSVLQNANAWLMCLGCPFTVTYLHYLEQSEKVPYRYLKRFIAKSAGSRGEVIEESIYYFVRNLELRNEIDWKGLRAYLYSNNILNKVPVGRVVLSGVNTEALDQSIRLLLNRNINGLLNLSDLIVE
jgi:aminoglycoside 3-N-acetyltransferase